MSSSKDFEQINFHPFNFFNDQDQDMRDPGLKSIKCQCCPHIETSQLICCAN